MSGYSDANADLLNSQSGNYQYLRDSAGLIETYVYGSTATATSTSAGHVAGYLKHAKADGIVSGRLPGCGKDLAA